MDRLDPRCVLAVLLAQRRRVPLGPGDDRGGVLQRPSLQARDQPLLAGRVAIASPVVLQRGELADRRVDREHAGEAPHRSLGEQSRSLGDDEGDVGPAGVPLQQPPGLPGPAQPPAQAVKVAVAEPRDPAQEQPPEAARRRHGGHPRFDLGHPRQRCLQLALHRAVAEHSLVDDEQPQGIGPRLRAHGADPRASSISRSASAATTPRSKRSTARFAASSPSRRTRSGSLS